MPSSGYGVSAQISGVQSGSGRSPEKNPEVAVGLLPPGLAVLCGSVSFCLPGAQPFLSSSKLSAAFPGSSYLWSCADSFAALLVS